MPSLPTLPHLLAASLILATSAGANAAPFWTGYRGTIANSTIPAIKNGERYTVNFIFDNGGTSANGQTWTGAHLKCMVWIMNDDKSVMFVQDLTKPNTNFISSGQIATDGAGTVTSMFTKTGHQTGGAGAGSFVGSGLPSLLTEPYAGVPATGLPSPTVVFIAGPAGQYTNYFGDSNTTISGPWAPVQPFANWGIQKNPRFASLTGCADPVPAPTTGSATPVPTLGVPALAALGLTAAVMGGLRLRRRKNVMR
ncbi:MAG: hypothetical protein LBE61_11920 [Burkholderiaceae bacterium]|nr:hypothetical protein [Burkholderiaceae bacterium]